MKFEFNNNVYIKATFSEDRENMIGVCRITDIEIECNSKLSHQKKEEIESKIYNYFAEKEYFTEAPDWRDNAKNDIRNYTGVSNVDIELN